MRTCIICGRNSSDATKIAGGACVSTWGCGGYATYPHPEPKLGASMTDPAYEWPIDIINSEGRGVLICAAPSPLRTDPKLKLGVRHGTCGAVITRSFTLHELVENLRHHIATVAHDLEVEWEDLVAGYEQPPVMKLPTIGSGGVYASTAATFYPGVTVSSGFAPGGVVSGGGGGTGGTFSGSGSLRRFTSIAGTAGTIPISSWYGGGTGAITFTSSDMTTTTNAVWEE